MCVCVPRRTRLLSVEICAIAVTLSMRNLKLNGCKQQKPDGTSQGLSKFTAGHLFFFLALLVFFTSLIYPQAVITLWGLHTAVANNFVLKQSEKQ